MEPSGQTSSGADPKLLEKAYSSQTAEAGKERFSWGPVVAMGLTGFSVGVLAGLSVSPVIAGVLTAIMGIAGGIVAGAAGLKTLVRSPLQPWPMAAFAIAIVIGAFGGIAARTNNVLGTDPLASEIERWSARGIEPDLVVRRAFAQAYPPAPGEFPLVTKIITSELQNWASVGITDTSMIGQQLLDVLPVVASATGAQAAPASDQGTTTVAYDTPIYSTVLSSGDADACDAFYYALRGNNNNYQDAFVQSPVEEWRRFTEVITDTATLKQIYELVLCPID